MVDVLAAPPERKGIIFERYFASRIISSACGRFRLLQYGRLVPEPRFAGMLFHVPATGLFVITSQAIQGAA
jgi:hypothetical protein